MENISLFKNQAMQDLHFSTISSERALYCLQFVMQITSFYLLTLANLEAVVMVESGSSLNLDGHWKTVYFVFQLDPLI